MIKSTHNICKGKKSDKILKKTKNDFFSSDNLCSKITVFITFEVTKCQVLIISADEKKLNNSEQASHGGFFYLPTQCSSRQGYKPLVNDDDKYAVNLYT